VIWLKQKSRCNIPVLALTLWWVFLSVPVWGVGLGKISLLSSLNEPLRAKITLDNSGQLRPSDVRVQLASKAIFDELGVAWSYNLDDLDVAIVSERGGPLSVASDLGSLGIELTSKTAIVEPFLNFVIEFEWPNGRLVREYTVLLDPPVLVAPMLVKGDSPQLSRPAPASSQTPSDSSPQSNFKEAWTQSGDTLWEIALANRPDRGTSVQEMMLAIQDRNPDAFINQNINRLKAGYRLTMPTAEDLAQLNFRDAVLEVADQNQSGLGPTTGALVAQSAQAVPAAEKKSLGNSSSDDASLGVGGELVLIADAEDDPIPKVSSDQSTMASELMRVSSALATAESEGEALKGRLAALESQLAAVTSAITVKDQQLAMLQRQLQDTPRGAAPAETNVLFTPISLGLIMAVVLLLVGLLFMSARYQRLARALRAAPAAQSPDLDRSVALSQSIVATDLAVKEAPIVEAEAEGKAPHVSEALETASPSVPEDAASGSIADNALEKENSAVQEAALRDNITPIEAQNSEDQPEIDIDIEIEDLSEDLDALDLDSLVELDDLDNLDQLEEAAADDAEIGLDGVGDALLEDEDPASMLDLARAYIDMGETASAKKLLNRVKIVGLSTEVQEAEQMLASLSPD